MANAAQQAAAKKEIEAHPAVKGTVEPFGLNIGFGLKFRIGVPKPSRGRMNGVLAEEEATLVFPDAWPYKAPRIWLRRTFARDLPHINPARELNQDYVEPCVIDEPIDEFVSHHGLTGLLNQLSDWLFRAAIDDLRELDGAWEPMRRDGIQSQVAVDIEELRSMIDCRWAGHSFLKGFLFVSDRDGEKNICGFIDGNDVNAKKAALLSKDDPTRAPVIFAWGHEVCSEIIPDGYMLLKEFIDEVAKVYGIKGLKTGLVELAKNLFDQEINQQYLFVILAVPRPKPLQGAGGLPNSNFELITYSVFLRPRKLEVGKDIYSYDENDFLFPLQLREKSTPKLLQRLSGFDFSNQKRLRLIGCGSIGSKLAMHLGKVGFGNIDLVDNRYLQPHNLARMGVTANHIRPWLVKSQAVKQELSMLGLEAQVIEGNFLDITASANKVSCSEDTAIVFDATASPSVHNALVSHEVESATASVMQGVFYAEGKVAKLAIEGSGRSPDLEDLRAHFWRWWMLKNLEGAVEWPGSDEEDLRRIQLGEGCGSLTMQMSDMQASLFVAGMANRVVQHLTSPPESEVGMLSIGRLNEDGMSVSWEHLECAPSITVDNEKGDLDWEVRILPDVASDIAAKAEASKAKGVETGGHLMGMVNPALRRITVTQNFPPPEGSKCSVTSCVLGKRGMIEQFKNAYNASRRAFFVLGTWHSHPHGGDESLVDWETLRDIAKDLYGNPAVSLIWRPEPEGFLVLVRQDWREGGE